MPEDERLPADLADMRLLIHALVDGELDAATALAVERRMADDPALVAEHARIAALQAAVARLPRPEVSAALHARVAALGRDDSATARPQPWRFASFDWRAMAASIMVTAVLASGSTYWATVGGMQADVAAAIASGHRRSLLAASPVDVASSDRHTVKPWLDAKLGLSPPAVDLASDGFALIGGRVEMIGDDPVPALVYRHREHLITLVAAPQQAGASAAVATGLSAGGFALVHWTDGAFSYWAISDTERSVLDDFVARFRAAVATGG